MEAFQFLQYQGVTNNPFAVLSAVAAPAILTNASSVLALGIGNRLGRVVDRTRIVAEDVASFPRDSPEYLAWSSQLTALELRAQMLIKALRLIYAALGLFATSALVSVAGYSAAFYGFRIAFAICAGLAILSGASAVVALGTGSSLMVQETRMAVHSLTEESKLRITMHGSRQPG